MIFAITVLDIEARIGRIFHAAVLFLELFHLPHMVHLQTDILLLPPIEGLFADSRVANHLRQQHFQLRVFQHSHNLLRGKSLLLHGKISLQVLPKTNICFGSKIPRPISGQIDVRGPDEPWYTGAAFELTHVNVCPIADFLARVVALYLQIFSQKFSHYPKFLGVLRTPNCARV
jgi:hypothetical protein